MLPSCGGTISSGRKMSRTGGDRRKEGRVMKRTGMGLVTILAAVILAAGVGLAQVEGIGSHHPQKKQGEAQKDGGGTMKGMMSGSMMGAGMMKRMMGAGGMMGAEVCGMTGKGGMM